MSTPESVSNGPNGSNGSNGPNGPNGPNGSNGPGQPSGEDRRSFWDVLAVVGGTLAIHQIIAILWPIGRFLKYPQAARLRVAGELPAERLTDFSPLYLELCTLIERVLGNSDQWLPGLHSAMVALAVGFFYLLLRSRFGRPMAFVGAALLAFDRRLVIYSRIFEPEAPMLLLVLAFTYVIVNVPAETKAWPRALLAGVLAALAVATRPTFLPLFALVPGFFLVDFWLRRKRAAGALGLRRALVPGLVFLAPVALMLVLLGWRATLATGSAGSPVMNPGTVFFEGNHPMSVGTSAIYPPSVAALGHHDRVSPDSAHEHYRWVSRANAAAMGEPEPDIAANNAFWSGRARAYLSDYPAAAFDHLLRKLRNSVHSFGWHDLPAARSYHQYLPLPTLPFAFLAALALIGMAVEGSTLKQWQERTAQGRMAVLFYGFAGMQWATVLIFYVSARQRLGLVPAFVFFALVSVEALARNHRRLLIFAAVSVLTLAGSLPDDAMLDETYRDRRMLTLRPRLVQLRHALEQRPAAHLKEEIVEAIAIAPYARDDIEPAFVPSQPMSLVERVAARQEKMLALASDNEFVSVAFDLAHSWLEIGRYREVVDLMEPLAETDRRIYRGGRQPSTAHFYLARALVLSGEEARGRAVLHEGLRLAPGDAHLLAELYALEDDPALGERLERYYGAMDARWLTARAHQAHGQLERAVVAYDAVLRHLPQLRSALLGKAACLGQLGRLDAGIDALRAANAISIEPLAHADDIADLALRWADTHSHVPPVQAEAASILFQFGRFFDARRLLHTLEDQPMPPPLASQVEALGQRLERAMEHWQAAPSPAPGTVNTGSPDRNIDGTGSPSDSVPESEVEP